MPLKNEQPKGHQVDLLLDCGHVANERIEAAIFAPMPGETRVCPKCGKVSVISKVSSPYYV
jgi:hypothetical protein